MSGDEGPQSARVPPKVDIMDLPINGRFMPVSGLADLSWRTEETEGGDNDDLKNLGEAELEARLRMSKIVSKRLKATLDAASAQNEAEWAAKEQLLSQMFSHSIGTSLE